MKRSLLLVSIVVIVVFSGCRKITGTTTIPDTSGLAAPNQFNWSSVNNVAVHLSNIPAGVIRISSSDNSGLYLKAMSDGNTAAMELAVVVPSFTDSLMINEFPVKINAGNVTFTFPARKKESMVTNYSMNFNGTTSWVKVSGATNLSFTSQYSVSAWVKPGLQQTAKIIEKGDWDGLGLGQDYWNGWQTSVAFTDGTSSVVDWGAGRPVLNQWYHLAGTYDGSDIRLYVDGILKKTVAATGAIRSNGRITSIGSDAGAQKFFKGLIDEVTIWNTALTAAQVATGRTTGYTGGESGLKGYWKFNEGSGATCIDGSADHYNGANISAAYSTDVNYALTVDTDQDGVPDTYDDYPLDATRAFNNGLPSIGFNTLLFEDLWPGQGDYDFNDLVAGYKFNTITNAQNKIVETYATFVIRAIGGGFQNGLGVQLTGSTIPQAAITCTGYSLHENYISLLSNGLEGSQAHPTFIVFDNAYKIMPGQSGVTGVNVSPGVPWITPDTIRIHLTYPAGTYTLSQLNLAAFNPFLIVNKTRGREVHLADYAPTSLASPSYFETANDNSKPAAGRYYKTKSNLPWALNIPGTFSYMSERKSILGGYLKMTPWAQSGGIQYPNWYLDLPGYRNNANIY